VIYSVNLALLGEQNLSIFYATALAAISYPFVTLVDHYLWTPDLEIEFEPGESDIYRPSMVLAFLDPVDQRNQITPTRIFVRVGVRNKGSKTAKHCMGEIELLSRTEGCNAFSKDPKVLQWTRSTEPIDILPKQFAVLAVAYAEHLGGRSFGGKCKFQHSMPLIRAWAATSEAIRYPETRLQDGFCMGEFKVRITIYSENSTPSSKEFVISVGSSYTDLTMRIV
jgi:hypothetical protein